MPSRWLSADALAFVALLGVLLVNTHDSGLNDPGTFWHPVVGERILQTGEIPRADWLTAPFSGQFWVPMQWLAEVVMALALRLGGYEALLILTCVVLAWVYAVCFRRLRVAGLRTPLAGALMILILAGSSYHFLARPLIVTIAGMCWVQCALVDRENRRVSDWGLWPLVPVGAVWANLHPGVLGGIVTYWFVLAGWALLWWLKRPGPVASGRELARLGTIGVLLTLSPLANPLGTDLFKPWLAVSGSPLLRRVISEHQALDPLNPMTHVALCLGLLYLVALVGTRGTPLRVTWLVPVVWLIGMMTSVRHGPLFAVTAAVALADVLPRTQWWPRLVGSAPNLVRPEGEPAPPLTRRALVLPVTVVILALAAQAARLPVVGPGWVRINPGVRPVGLLGPITEYADSVPPGTPVFNDIAFGGFLARYAPRLRYLADDRYELCGDAWLREYLQVTRKRFEGVEEWCDRYGMERALVAAAGHVELFEYLSASPRWRLVARIDEAAWFERVGR